MRSMRKQIFSGAVIADLESQLKCSNLFDWLELEASKLSALGRRGNTPRTFLTKEMFATRSILKVVGKPSLIQNACILSFEAGYKIQYQPSLPPLRRRFAIAHELGHTYFFAAKGSTKSISGYQCGEDPTIESLCDFFAVSLLIPKSAIIRRVRELVNETIDTKIPPLHLVPLLAREFNVAEQAIARRLAFDMSRNCQSVFCLKRELGKKDSPWQTVWFAPASGFNTNIPTGWRIALDTWGKSIPVEMVPDTPVGQTVEVLLDGRLFLASKPQNPTNSKLPLKRQAELPGKHSYLARCFSKLNSKGPSMELAFMAIPASISV